jgi:protein-S-isoprenylcysteine O-methyltransferase Ste14
VALLARTVAGFIFLFAVMGLALFGAAGRLSFWRGWVFLGAYAAASTLITVWLWRHDRALLERRVRAGPGAEPEPVQNLIQALAGVIFLASIIIPGLDCRFGWSRMPAWTAVLGDVLVALGFLVVFLTFRENHFTSAVIEQMEGQKVIDTGPYAIVRHPLYAGALPMFLGGPFALGSWWDLLTVPPIVALLAWRLIEEERFLVRHLDGYADYRRRVRWRLAPGLW